MDKQPASDKKKKQIKNLLVSHIATMILKKKHEDKIQNNGKLNKESGSSDLFTEPR